MHLGKGEEIEKAIEELFEDPEDFQGIEGKELSEKIMTSLPAQKFLSKRLKSLEKLLSGVAAF